MFRTFGSTFTRGLAATIVTATLAFAVIGCSSSDNMTTTDSGPCTETDVFAIFNKQVHGGCALCHDSTGNGAGLDMQSPGLAARLVNKTPAGGGTTYVALSCGMGKIYLNQGSNPATGYFLEKLSSPSPSCGVQMPYVGTKLNSTELACVQSWANTVTSP